MLDVRVLAEARAEFREAFHWYRDRSPQAAKDFAIRVRSAIISIREHPEQHLRWDDRYRIYLLSRFPYYVAYRATNREIIIVAIRHVAQDQDVWQSR